MMTKITRWILNKLIIIFPFIDNHYLGKFVRDLWLLFSFIKYQGIDVYDEDGKPVFYGLNYYKDGEEYTKIIWMDSKLHEEFKELLGENYFFYED